MTPATGTLRVLRLAGLLLWVLIAVAALVEGMGRPRGFTLWGAGLLGFGALYGWATSRQPSWPVLAAQVGCVLVMAGGQYRGFEGMLRGAGGGAAAGGGGLGGGRRPSPGFWGPCGGGGPPRGRFDRGPPGAASPRS